MHIHKGYFTFFLLFIFYVDHDAAQPSGPHCLLLQYPKSVCHRCSKQSQGLQQGVML